MKALGLIETKGLLSAVVALDNMLKAANVQFKSKIFVGEGLVEISVEGGVDAVKTSVACAVGALKDKGTLISYHVIPRAYDDVVLMFNDNNDRLKVEGITVLATNITKNNIEYKKAINENLEKEKKQEIEKDEHKVEKIEKTEKIEKAEKTEKIEKAESINSETKKEKEIPKNEIEKKETKKNNTNQSLSKENLLTFSVTKLRTLGKKLSINTGNKKLNNMEKDELIEAILKKINKK